jgi:beta-ribofuranosylaminobenzene 5'-phosphate synthase
MRLTAYPRIHVGLADMGFASLRSFGGVGFAIEYSPTVIEFDFGNEFALEGTEDLDQAARGDLDQVLARLRLIPAVRSFRAKVLSHAPQHNGFGSKTSLALSLVTGADQLCGLGLGREQIQRLSGRGGASGVGIHAFFEGGVICDGGHTVSADRTLSPSSAGAAGEIPPRLARLEFPIDWRVMLLLSGSPPLSGEDELDFFRKNAPVERYDALETIAQLYHGVLPAFALKDYKALATSLAGLHARGFKMRELQRCDERTRRCFKLLARQGFAVGLSSVGPLIYSIVHKDDQIAMERVIADASQAGMDLLGTVSGRNAGYQLAGLSAS